MYFALACVAIFAYTVIEASRRKPKKLQPEEPSTYLETTDQIKEIRYKNRLYDVTNWVKRHPGGKIIEFYVNNGEDATEAVGQFHFRSASKVQKILETFPSRDILPEFLKTSPKYGELSQDFENLFLELLAAGFFKTCSWHVFWRVAEVISLMVLGFVATVKAETYSGLILGGAIIGIFQIRAGYFMHEAGHNSITGWPKLDKLFQAVMLGFGVGLSASWWRSQHNRHHAMPQRLNYDVDLETLPGLAYNVKVFDQERHKTDVLLRNQKFLYVPTISTLGILGWKFLIHPRHMWRSRQYIEIACAVLHYVVIYLYLGFTPYISMTAVFSSGLLLNFGLSHSHLPIAEEPRHWVEYCLLHTMNIQPSWWCDWWMGYLNYQIEHHLFPTIPHFRLRQIRPKVMTLARKHGLPYICTTYSEALAKFFDNLGHVAEELSHMPKLEQ